ncbi:cytochrome p450 71d9 [Quercus suber]|uniref:Cytochrome p450 71d9 n=1 Tax=Quercus suber TaxID=58331 RepID=A0AAW0KI97_QUESU
METNAKNLCHGTPKSQACPEIIILGGGFDMPDLFPSLKFLGFLTGIKPALLKMHRKTDKILNNIINDHKKKRSVILAKKM